MIISVRREGIANRIKSLISAFRLEPDQAFVFWEPQVKIFIDHQGSKVPHRSPSRFHDLFCNPIEIQKPFPKDARIYDSWRLAVLPQDKLPEGFSPSTLSDADPNGRNIDFQYHRIPKKIKRAYLNEFEKLQVQPNILNEVNQFQKEYLNQSFISIHVRSWADIAGKTRRKEFQLAPFLGEISNLSSNQKVFLASDSMEVSKQIQALFPQVITYRTDQERTSEVDLIELLLLSRGQALIGTHLSTFTEVAWWFGHASQPIKII